VPVHDLRILIAEDNLINQKVALGQLQTLGYPADVVANGREVLELLEALIYDVILMDCQMPEMDGYDATRRIREIEGRTRRQRAGRGLQRRRLFIIAMTANAMQGDREKCLAAGMDDYISKPVRAADLQAALERRKYARGGPEAGTTERHDVSDLLDAAMIEELRRLPDEGGVPMLDRLVDLLLEEGPRHIEEIKAAADNREALAAVAHRFKGACLNIGAARVAEVCQEFHSLSATGDRVAIEKAIQRLEDAFEQTRVAFARLRV
jgi:CheY-like chemotaxis protein/HPt (histidine-containing phosphotransfer) domain-containing protein